MHIQYTVYTVFLILYMLEVENLLKRECGPEPPRHCWRGWRPLMDVLRGRSGAPPVVPDGVELAKEGQTHVFQAMFIDFHCFSLLFIAFQLFFNGFSLDFLWILIGSLDGLPLFHRQSVSPPPAGHERKSHSRQIHLEANASRHLRGAWL